MRSSRGFLARPAAVCLASSLGAAAVWAGGRSLPAPPALHPAGWAAWWRTVGPVDGVFALARCGMVAGTVTITVLATAVLATRLLLLAGHTGPAVWNRFTRWATGAGSSRLGGLLLGFSASGGLLTGCGLAGGPPAPHLALTGPGAGVAAGVRLAEPAGTPARPPTGPAVPAPPRVAIPGRPPARRVPPPPTVAPAPRTWTVRPGDDFWSIAEVVVGRAATGPGPATRVAPYWSRLVAANRERLPVPGDPDLLFPGQVLVLPPVAGPAGAPD